MGLIDYLSHKRQAVLARKQRIAEGREGARALPRCTPA